MLVRKEPAAVLGNTMVFVLCICPLYFHVVSSWMGNFIKRKTIEGSKVDLDIELSVR